MIERVLTIWQPWADLIMAGVKDVENRTWDYPSTLPQWGECGYHGRTAPEDLELVTDTPTVGPYWRHWSRDGYQCPVNLDGRFPFRLWIHAGKKVDGSNDRGQWHEWGNVRPAEDPRTGVLLGYVTVTGWHHVMECGGSCSPRWADVPPDDSMDADAEPRHLVLADPFVLPEPIPTRGHQRLWSLDFLPDDARADLGRQLAAAEGVTA